MPRRKFPNTLRRVSMDAVNARKEYRDRFDRSIGSGSRLGKVSLESYPTFYDASADEVVEASREHYHAHEAEYYDLALIDAHLEGVVINTPSPLTIGMRPEEALAEPPQTPPEPAS
jgi:hypothetical protein